MHTTCHACSLSSIFYFFVVRGLERENEKNKTNKRRERNASWLRRKKDQKFERKDIEIGISDGINVEIISGLTLEDKIKVWNKTEAKKLGEDETADQE